MSEEQKNSLIKHLCAMLPYNIMAEYKNEAYSILGFTNGKVVICKPFMSNSIGVEPEEIKLYLRPMTDMTGEERDELYETTHLVISEEWTFSHNAYVALDWFNSKHLDYRNLIGMGIAVKMPKELYNYINL